MAREQRRAPPRHSHGDPTSLAPHERLTDLAVVPREKPHTGAAAREQPRDSPVIERGGPSSPAWPRDQSRDLSPNASGGLTPFSPPSELQEIPVATREQSGVLCYHSRWRPVSPGCLECNPEIPVAPGEEHWLLDTSLDEVYWPCRHSRESPSFPSQLEWKIGLPWAYTSGILNSPS